MATEDPLASLNEPQLIVVRDTLLRNNPTADREEVTQMVAELFLEGVTDINRLRSKLDYQLRKPPGEIASGDMFDILDVERDPVDGIEPPPDPEAYIEQAREHVELVDPQLWQAYYLVHHNGLTYDAMSEQLGVSRAKAFRMVAEAQNILDQKMKVPVT